MKNLTYVNLLNQRKYAVLLELVIGNNDVEELQSALKYNEVVKTLSQSSNYFLDQSYKSKNLAIAKFLLSYGVSFNIKHLAYLDKDANKIADHIKHLHDIRPYLSIEQFDLAFNYIITFCSNPLSTTTQKGCYVAEDILTSLTYTNNGSKADSIKKMYKSLYLHSTPIIHDILEVIVLSNFKNTSLKIFMPFGPPLAYLHAVRSSDDKIYLTMNNLELSEQGFLMHEFTHYAEDTLVKNKEKPYRIDDVEAMNFYHRAAKESLANILSLFNLNKEKIITQEMLNDESVTLKDICSKVTAVVPLNIFSFYGQPNQKEHNNLLSKAYLDHVGSSDKHKFHFLKHYLDNVVNAYKFDNTTVYSLSRMADLCLRSVDELEHEPPAFAVELEVHRISNIFKPLVTLLHSNIATMLSDLRVKEGLSECPRTLDNVVLQTLSTIEVDATGKVVDYTNDTL